MDIKQEAKRLRIKGLSYNVISRKLLVPKGTLSYWFKKDQRFKKITEKNVKAANFNAAINITKYNKKRSIIAREKWLEIEKQAQKEISKISKDDLFLIGVSLYWAEGYKRGNWNVVFTNSDSDMNVIMLRFFRVCCFVPKEKIRLHLQVHQKDQVEKSINFWANKLKMPRKFFLKTTIQKNVIKKNTKRRLPYGTLRIKINDVILVNKIRGWIKGLILSSGCGS